MWSNSRKPALSWLDRLRSSKGIPTTTDLNLEQFLKQSPNSSDPKPKPIPQQNQDPDQDQESTWFNTMSSVLAELFVMEDKSSNKKIHKKKVPRKQTNPKICVLSRSVVVDDDDCSGGGGGGVEVEVGVVSPDNSVVNNEEDEDFDVSECSRLDCVVIDTSNVEWKSENMVMRRGNVWRVREKNLKLKKISLMKKKRKAKKIDNDDDDEDDDDNEDEKKKKKRKKKKMKQKVRSTSMTSISNKKDEDEDEQCGVLPFEGSPVNNNQISIKRTHPNLDQAPIKSRCKFLSLSANPGKKSFVPHL